MFRDQICSVPDLFRNSTTSNAADTATPTFCIIRDVRTTTKLLINTDYTETREREREERGDR